MLVAAAPHAYEAPRASKHGAHIKNRAPDAAPLALQPAAATALAITAAVTLIIPR